MKLKFIEENLILHNKMKGHGFLGLESFTFEKNLLSNNSSIYQKFENNFTFVKNIVEDLASFKNNSIFLDFYQEEKLKRKTAEYTNNVTYQNIVFLNKDKFKVEFILNDYRIFIRLSNDMGIILEITLMGLICKITFPLHTANFTLNKEGKGSAAVFDKLEIKSIESLDQLSDIYYDFFVSKGFFGGAKASKNFKNIYTSLNKESFEISKILKKSYQLLTEEHLSKTSLREKNLLLDKKRKESYLAELEEF